MRRLVLTQSQVSVAATSTVVLLFTFAIFLAGFVLQQRSVRDLSDSIKPRIPLPPPPTADIQQTQQEIAERLLRLRYAHRQGDRVALADLSRDIHAADIHIDWNRLAHFQLVRDHDEVCNAIMILAELHRMKSPARRVLLFPQAWAEEKRAARGEVSDPFMDSTRRLLRLAARRYHIELLPVKPVQVMTSTGQHQDAYSLASAFGLYKDFDRVLTIEAPGLLIEAEPLDAILAFTETTPLTMLHDTQEQDGVHAEDLLLLTPSEQTFNVLKEQIAHNTSLVASTRDLSQSFANPLLLSSHTSTSALVRSIGALHSATDDTFNQSAFLSDVAYIRFSDPKFPGPEYDVPWPIKLAARPHAKKADWTWTNLYGRFAQLRMEVCGLDLQPWIGDT